MSESPTLETRAPVPAREGREIIILQIRIPSDARRTPLVFVEVERAGLRLTFAVARWRGVLEVRPPRAPDGEGEGVWMPKPARDRIGDAILAAVEADPAARAALRRGGWM